MCNEYCISVDTNYYQLRRETIFTHSSEIYVYCDICIDTITWLVHGARCMLYGVACNGMASDIGYWASNDCCNFLWQQQINLLKIQSVLWFDNLSNDNKRTQTIVVSGSILKPYFRQMMKNTILLIYDP